MGKSGEYTFFHFQTQRSFNLAANRAKFLIRLNVSNFLSIQLSSVCLHEGKFYMFVGEYKHSIDEKGRIAVPSKFRSSLKSGAVVTKGLDNCLFVLPMAEWKKWASEISKLPVSKADSRAFARHMFGEASDVKLDGQGRIILPTRLKKFANIKKTAVFVGLYNKLELWAEKTWERYKQKTERQSTQIAERMSDLGI